MVRKLALCLMAVMVGSCLYGGEVTPFYDGNNTPIYEEATLGGFTVYIVGGSTTSAATCSVFASSIEFTTAGGLYPGTTNIVFSEARADTLYELVDVINNLSTTGLGSEGGVVAYFVQGTYRDNESARMTAIANVSILGVANATQFNTVTTNGISYILEYSDLDSRQQYHIGDISCNLRFNTGQGFINIYDGFSSTNTQLRGEEFYLSGIDAKADISGVGIFHGTMANSYYGTGGTIRFDVFGSSNISTGKFNMSLYSELRQK